MAMPGGGGMGPMPPQQQSMMSPHQQMVAQQQQQHQQAVAAAAAAAAAAAQQAQQQGHPLMQSPMGGGPGGPGPIPGGQPHPQPPPTQQGGPPPQAQEQARVDNISKAKILIPSIKESMLNVMRNGAMAINANSMIDSGTKQVDFDVNKFDKAFEEFFSLIGQLEVHLRTSVECLSQSGQSAKYLPVPIAPTKSDSTMTYPQYIDLVKGQITYAKEIHGALTEASQRLSE